MPWIHEHNNITDKIKSRCQATTQPGSWQEEHSQEYARSMYTSHHTILSLFCCPSCSCFFVIVAVHPFCSCCCCLFSLFYKVFQGETVVDLLDSMFLLLLMFLWLLFVFTFFIKFSRVRLLSTRWCRCLATKESLVMAKRGALAMLSLIVVVLPVLVLVVVVVVLSDGQERCACYVVQSRWLEFSFLWMLKYGW